MNLIIHNRKNTKNGLFFEQISKYAYAHDMSHDLFTFSSIGSLAK